VYTERLIFRAVDAQLLSGRQHVGASTALFKKNHVWVDIPGDRVCLASCLGNSADRLVVTFIHVENPFDLEISESSQLETQSSPSRACSLERYRQADGLSTTHDDESPKCPSPQPASPIHATTPVLAGRASDDKVDRNILAVRLLRHFKEGPGQW
jgi:hypothetical protein